MYCSCSDVTVLRGRVEARLNEVCAETGGQIVDAPAVMGESVKMGELLAKIDDADYRFTLDQLQSSLAAAKDTEKIDEIARESAENTAVAAHKELRRNLALLSVGGVSRQVIDNLTEEAETADHNAASAAVQIQSARENILLIESQIAQCRNNIAKTEIRAPCDGVVMGKYYEKGDVAAAGSAVFDIAAGSYVLAYFDEAHINRIGLSTPAEITGRGKDGKKETVTGQVIFLDANSEYTPREFRSSANINKKSVRIKVSIPSGADFQLDEEVRLRI
jgi:multidrug resistance efflux pump